MMDKRRGKPGVYPLFQDGWQCSPGWRASTEYASRFSIRAIPEESTPNGVCINSDTFNQIYYQLLRPGAAV
jgi:hypothetical protein